MIDEKMNNAEKHLLFKTIVEAEIDGDGIRLKLSDGSVFDYYASDGGYSSWEITKGGEEE